MKVVTPKDPQDQFNETATMLSVVASAAGLLYVLISLFLSVYLR